MEEGPSDPVPSAREEATLARTLITLGALFFLGLLTDLLGRHSFLPRVTLLMFFGLLIGPSALDVLPADGRDWFPLAANVALVMVGFLLGGGLSLRQLRERGGPLLRLSGAKALVAFAVAAAGLALLGFGVELALLLGAVASATDPAATAAVVGEERAAGPFTDRLLGVVALDDAWGLVLFSLVLAGCEAIGGGGGLATLGRGAWEVGGAVALGLALGVPSAALTGRVEPGEPTLVEVLAILFLCSGLALWLGVSFLLASMVLGATVATLAHHHRRPFHAIEGIEWPFMILFFVLAGASLDLGSLGHVGALLVAYVVLRAVGTCLGTGLAARREPEVAAQGGWLGVALLPQAGVALGMALVAVERLPERAADILPVAIAGTAFFELLGPTLTRVALRRVGESGAAR